MTTIEINEETKNKFSMINLEKFINSKDFEDIVLWYHMLNWETWKTQSFNSFKKEIWL